MIRLSAVWLPDSFCKSSSVYPNIFANPLSQLSLIIDQRVYSLYLCIQKPANYDSQQVLAVLSLIEEVTVSFLI